MHGNASGNRDSRAESSSGADDTQGPVAEQGASSKWEWVIAVLGALVVITAVVILIRAAMRPGADSLPQITAQVDSIARTGADYLVRVRVVNAGGQPAADVRVEGTLTTASGVAERSETAIAYLPPGSTRSAGLIFTKAPRDHRLEVRVIGYDEP